VIFVKEGVQETEVERCTASLIAPDRILTNGHCGHPTAENDFFIPERAYFFFRAGEQTLFKPLGPRIFERFGFAEDEESISPDLAVYTLGEPVREVQSLRVSRVASSAMPVLTAYMINQDFNGRPFVDLVLDRQTCTTVGSQPLFRGGVQDMGIGLALYGCTVVSGNSGAPVFLPDQPGVIQAVINSSIFWSSRASTLARFSKLFEKMPPSLAQDAGMANRVQCLEIDGEPAPEETCTLRHLKTLTEESLQGAARQALAEAFTRLPMDAIVWGFDLVPMDEELESPAEFSTVMLKREVNSMLLMPKPLCVRGDTIPAADSAVPAMSFALMLAAEGTPVHKKLRETELPVSVDGSATEGWTVRLTLPDELAQMGESEFDLPACTGGELDANHGELEESLQLLGE
jgi:hypothetical protein